MVIVNSVCTVTHKWISALLVVGTTQSVILLLILYLQCSNYKKKKTIKTINISIGFRIIQSVRIYCLHKIKELGEGGIMFVLQVLA